MTSAILPIARALGFAGLIPQLFAMALVAGGRPQEWLFGRVLALVYGIVILSFLGGIWWGFAMRRAQGQGALAAVAVVPSLVGVGLMVATQFGLPIRSSLILLALAVAATLLVDRRLAASGEAPEGWMRLRGPLSLSLAAVTLITGLLA